MKTIKIKITKLYLGDSVYVEFDGHGMLLTTENGALPPSNAIYLEPETWFALESYVRALRTGVNEAKVTT